MSVFKKYKYWIHSAKYTTIQKFAVLGIGILSFMFLARMLGPAGYGVWGLFMIMSAITETARNALIRNAFIRFSHQHPETEQGKLQEAAFILSIVLSLLLAIGFLLLAHPMAKLLKAPELVIMLNIYSISLMISVIFSHCETILNANMHFKGICWMNCVRQGTLLLGILIFYFFKIEITAAILGILYLTAMISGSLVGLKMGWPFLRWQYGAYMEWLPELWKYGKFVFGNNLFSQLFRSTDNFITSRYYGPAISGYYNASLRISNLVDMPSAVLADILFPKIAKYNTADKASIKHMYEKAVGATMIFSIPALLVLLIFPETILHILAGRQFVQAAPILRITAFFGFVLPFLKQFGTVMDATGTPHINFRVMFLAFCINVGTNVAGVYMWGMIGAAIGTATTYFIIFVICQLILYKRFGINPLNVLKNTVWLCGEFVNNMRGSAKLNKATK